MISEQDKQGMWKESNTGWKKDWYLRQKMMSKHGLTQ